MTYQDTARNILQRGTATEKATTLVSISRWDEVPDDLVEMISSLLDDRSVAQMFVPFRYGELRYLATQTYALIRLRRGFKESVAVRDTIAPMKAGTIGRLCEEAGIPFESDDPIDWFMELRARGLLPLTDEVFDERSFDLDA